MQETCVPSLGREDALEKGTATHSSILAWRIPWAEEPGGLQSMGSQRVRHNRSDVAQHSTGGRWKRLAVSSVTPGSGSVEVSLSVEFNIHPAA